MVMPVLSLNNYSVDNSRCSCCRTNVWRYEHEDEVYDTGYSRHRRRRRRREHRNSVPITSVALLACALSLPMQQQVQCFHPQFPSGLTQLQCPVGENTSTVPVLLHSRRHRRTRDRNTIVRSALTSTGYGKSVAVRVTKADDVENRDCEHPIQRSSGIVVVVEKLQSYVYNLQRSSRHRANNREIDSNHQSHIDLHEIKAAASLANFLENGTIDVPSSSGGDDLDSLVNLLERCVTQAIRRAGEERNYRLILRLVSSAVKFANEQPILSPRIFGEAIEALSERTDANVSKIKSVWSYLVDTASIPSRPRVSRIHNNEHFPSYLTGCATTYELNIFLKALSTRDRPTACIEAYKQYSGYEDGKSRRISSSTHPITIQPDSYTASIMFLMLAKSILPHQTPALQKSTGEVLTENGTDNYKVSLASKLVAISPRSTCWQWNVAVDIMDSLQKSELEGKREGWNNRAYSALLSLQTKAQESFGNGSGHNMGPELTMTILNHMSAKNITPDVVTCTLALKSLGESREGRLHYDGDQTPISSKNLAVNFLREMISDERLPNPNTNACTAAIKGCVRQGDFVTALGILETMRSDTIRSKQSLLEAETARWPQPNTWTYNIVLSALKKSSVDNVESDRNGCRKDKTGQALQLLDQMKQDHTQHQMDTVPDAVTYNTILAIGPLVPPEESSINDGTFVMSIMDEMRKEGIDPDEHTFHNAITSSASSSEVMTIVQMCLSTTTKLKAEAMTSIFHRGLFFLSSRRDFTAFKSLLSQMHESEVRMDHDTAKLIIQMLSKCGHTSRLESFLRLLKLAPSSDHSDSSRDILRLVGLGANPSFEPTPFDPSEVLAIFTEAVSGCLEFGDFRTAKRILSMMREINIRPSRECQEIIATAYASSCLRPSKAFVDNVTEHEDNTRHQAASAYRIVMGMKNSKPQLKVIGKVAKACAKTCQWGKTRTLLHLFHNEIIGMDMDELEGNIRMYHGVKATHGYIMRQCALHRNITAASWFTNDIRSFGRSMSQKYNETVRTGSHRLPAERLDYQDTSLFSVTLQNLTSITARSEQPVTWGMKYDDWVSLIKVASCTGYWRIAVTSLQQLQPYVESTKPKDVDEEKASKVQVERYNQLVPAFVATVKCLEQQQQYAWALRVVKDWMHWSERKPRAAAVLSAVRVLAANGLVDEIKELLAHSTSKDLVHVANKKEESYEQMLYSGAVTSLHINGMYDAADEVYMAGVTNSFLSFDFVANNGQFMLDLHGLNVALAHSAVRVALRQHATALDEVEEDEKKCDLLIITGRGRNSAVHMRPVLRPQVQNMLTEEFFPSLSSFSVPGNTGRLVVPWRDVLEWQNHQQLQKGARMLELASLLKHASNPQRLRRLIELSVGDEDDT